MLRAHSRQDATGFDGFRRVLDKFGRVLALQNSKKNVFFLLLQPLKTHRNLSEPVGTRRILSGMGPKHSQPLAASERQEAPASPVQPRQPAQQPSSASPAPAQPSPARPASPAQPAQPSPARPERVPENSLFVAGLGLGWGPLPKFQPFLSF